MKQPCMFCDHKGYLPELLNMALYSRYQSDYCPLQLRSPSMIRFQDTVCYEELEEFLKSYQPLLSRYYSFPYLKAKQRQLIEYYRYHQDIPRFFIEKITPQLEVYHEKQREIRYKKIKLQLGMQVEESTREDAHFSFKALKGLTVLQTSRVLQEMLQLIPSQPKQLRFDKNVLASLIQKQKQQMQQTKPTLKRLLSNPTIPNKTYRTCHTLTDQNPPKSHKKQLTLCTEQSQRPERNEFYKKWSDILSHRELEYHKNKLKSTCLNKKKSLK